MLESVYNWLVYGSAFFQSVFVLMWLILPWWRSWVGRALMLKSVAFMIALDIQSYFLIHPDVSYDTALAIGVAAFVLIFAGCFAQCVALAFEMKKHTQHEIIKGVK